MKIIIGATEDDRVIGIAAAFTAMGFDIDLWLPSKPSYDMMAEKKPDYLILSSEHLTNGVIEAVKEFKVKVVIYGVNVPEPIKEYVKLVLIPDVAPKVIADNIDANNLVLHRAANLAQFRKGHYQEKLASDICHISAYRGDGSVPKDVMRQIGGLLPLLPHTLKVCGPVRLPCAQYLGLLTQSDIMGMLKSTKINIDYDTNLLLDCAANKVFTLSNQPNPLFPSFSNDTELASLIEDFVDNEKARRNICKKAYKHVINDHTYFHRVIEIAEKLGEETWVDIANQTYQRMRG